MAELNQVEPTQETPENTETPTTEPAKEPTVNELAEKLEKLSKQLDVKDKEVNGLNRRNSELENKQKELEREKLSEEDRAKAELAELREQAEQAQRERDEAKRQTLIDKLLTQESLPLTFAGRIKGETPEEIEADVKEFASHYKLDVKTTSESEINRRLGNPAPTNGKPSSEKLTLEEIAKIPDAKKRSEERKKLGY